jgi:hypothetical protein
MWNSQQDTLEYDQERRSGPWLKHDRVPSCTIRCQRCQPSQMKVNGRRQLQTGLLVAVFRSSAKGLVASLQRQLGVRKLRLCDRMRFRNYALEMWHSHIVCLAQVCVSLRTISTVLSCSNPMQDAGSHLRRKSAFGSLVSRGAFARLPRHFLKASTNRWTALEDFLPQKYRPWMSIVYHCVSPSSRPEFSEQA